MAPSNATTWPDRLRELVGIDVRSLALLRIGLGVVLLVDLFARTFDLRDHYSDWGVLPRLAASDWLPIRSRVFPAYFLDGSAGWSAALFTLTAAAAVCLILGWRTRLATIACWYLVSSLQIRNPSVLHGGDNVLRIMLFWSIFLPLAAAWSLDHRRKRASGTATEAEPRIVSVATLAIQFQLCFVYIFTALVKSDPSWTHERSAVLRALHLDHMTTSWGALLRGFPTLLELATTATLVLELAGPLLLWIPWLVGPIRFAVALTFMVFHLGLLAPAFDLGIFPWVAAVAWSIFLPTWFWERVRVPAITRSRGKSNGATEPEDGELAVTARAAPTPFWLTLGRRLQSTAVAALLIVALLWNLRDLDPDRFARLLPPGIDPLVECLGIQQSWRMFAPRPPAEDGWYVIPGQQKDGRTVDVLRGGAVDFTRPDDINSTFMNSRWIKYLMNMTDLEYLTHRPLMTQYLCRRWNHRHEGTEQLSQLEVIFMLETFLPETGVQEPLPQSLGGQICTVSSAAD